MIHTLMLAAHAEALGVGWVSILDSTALSNTLAAPAHWQFIAYLLIGYPIEASDVPELMRVGWQQRSDFAERWLER
jgi:nitroreductase